MYIRYCIVFVLFISLCLMLLPAQCFDQLTKPPVRQLAIFSKSQNNVESILTTLPAMKLILLNEKYLDKFQDNSTCTTCIENLKIIARNINNKSDNALKVLDAWGTRESGLYGQGNIHWPGRYYQCRSVHDVNGKIDGKWCLAAIPLKKTNKGPPRTIPLPAPTLQVGICVPDTCSACTIQRLLTGAVRHKFRPIVTCPLPPHQMKTSNICAVFLLLIISVVVIALTSFQYYLKYKETCLENVIDDETNLPNDRTQQKKQSLLTSILESVSITNNCKRLVATKPSDISCLHGIRFISITWIILGHCVAFSPPFINNSKEVGSYILHHFSFIMVLSATFAVDTFFFLSGLLVSYLGLKHIQSHNGKINVALAYLMRYLRITPLYAFIIFFTVFIYPSLGEGPMFMPASARRADKCRTYWWTNLLYINNIYPIRLNDGCVQYGWYLANDMQCNIIAPFVLIMLYRRPKIGKLLLAFGVGFSVLITAVLSTIYSKKPDAIAFYELSHLVSDIHNQAKVPVVHGTNTSTTNVHGSSLASNIYSSPWCRIGAYLVGIATGYIIHTTNDTLKIAKIYNITGWLLSASTSLSLVFALYANRNSISEPVAVLFNGVSRPLWCTSLAWICIACINNSGGWVNAILSWKVFIPLSRLTYACYFIHPLVVTALYTTQEVYVHFGPLILAVYFTATTAFTLALGVVVHLLIEAPTAALLRLLVTRLKNRKTQQERSSE